MKIELIPVHIENKAILSNLYQLYQYDFSSYTNQDVNVDGRYEVNIDFFWEGDGRWKPFFIKTSNSIVGFLVVLFENMDIDPDPTHVIYDFIILQKYRRTGIGRAAALEALKMYKANWAVSQMDNNTPAIAFWRNVISELKGSHFTEIYKPERKKYVQEFSTRD